MAAKSKAAAAKAEVEETPEGRTIEWQGLTFELPPLLPETVLLDMAVLETSDNPTASFKLIKRVLGEAQFNLVIQKVDTEEDVTLANVAELTGQIFDEYGTSEGESEASPGS